MLIKVSIATAAVVLAACSSPQDVDDAVGVDQAQAAGEGGETAQETLDRRLAGGAQPRTIEIENEQMKFTYSWPAQAAAIAPLNSFMETQAQVEQEEFDAMTAEARSDAERHDYPFRPYDFSRGWDMAADTPGYLSLAAVTYTYTGGAHGNSVFGSMIWDRKAEEAMPQTDFFASSEALEGAVREAYCTGLKAERTERLGANTTNGTDIFDSCPALEELVIVLGSADGKKFNSINLMAAPYVAGSYAEGPYEVTIPVTQAVIDATKPEYRAAFALGG